jgi:guanosine-3',5'-bis(diphosphate) 3'-pyrophosphohydrolase
MTLNLERALRWAALFHRGQERKGSGVPYVQHVVAVAMILDRLGFAEEVVIAGLLHDLVEDTEATLDQVREAFGEQVAATVALCSERKTDSAGRKRPWVDRKREHLELLIAAPLAARAVMLADKLHNLLSIQFDLREGRDVWSTFNAERAQVIWYYESVIERCADDDPRLAALATECREAIQALEGL